LKSVKYHKVLIITSSGGGGLLQAAAAKEQELLAKDSNVIIVKRDILKDWYWKAIGWFAEYAWNLAQRKGKVSVLEYLLRMQRAADPLFWLQVFICAFTTFCREKPERVIDTQPLGTSAILRALRLYNWWYGKKVVVEKVIVDLPTKLNTHFFRAIRRLSVKSRVLIRLVTIPPLLYEGETSEQFWRANCNLSEREIIYEYYPVRQPFRKLQETRRDSDNDFYLTVNFQDTAESGLFCRTVQRGPLHVSANDQQARMRIGSKDKLFTILLGSQPAYNATLEYVSQFIQLVAESQPNICSPVHLLVFCGKSCNGAQNLIQAVSDLVVTGKSYPDHLTVVPLGFQNDETVARVFYRSDLTCTRSGGQTAMELLCVMQGEIWIHSEAVKGPGQNELTLPQLLRGIPGWEAGSAIYLQKARNAKIVTPHIFAPFGRELLKS
jgi:hypothetical protein